MGQVFVGRMISVHRFIFVIKNLKVFLTTKVFFKTWKQKSPRTLTSPKVNLNTWIWPFAILYIKCENVIF